ncbi:AMIN domain-containing protein [Desulfovibrio litoralis]|uniref:AMIN domain-containing protein n=1 Tax=Desulfovibrio litoralis DSM 11393 TaxID=1121455 RepID=A0A1M7T711_9BACT|nr:AMIN domain-containing protein [Desulfovibrio litoralis]SHN66422.1 AMIN domain-containing protein [Desulfovibrio litoralis DSM 11393]
MNKNAVVLILSVLFLAMILVVVNQILYSGSPEPTLVTQQNTTALTTSLDSIPLTPADTNTNSTVSPSTIHSAETTPPANMTSTLNTAYNSTNQNSLTSQPQTQTAQTTTPPVQTQVQTQAQTTQPQKTETAPVYKEPEKTEPIKVKEPDKAKTEKEDNATKNTRNSGPAQIEKIGIHFADKRMLLKVVADSGFETKWFTLTAPDRLVVDFPEPVKNLTVPSVPNNRIIKSARIGKQQKGYRLVLDLNAAVKVQAKNNKAGLLEIYIEEK